MSAIKFFQTIKMRGKKADIKVIIGIIIVLLLFIFYALYTRSGGSTMSEMIRKIFMVGR